MAYAIILITIVIILALTINFIERLRDEDWKWSKLIFWRFSGGN
jgi:hypothetical protein